MFISDAVSAESGGDDCDDEDNVDENRTPRQTSEDLYVFFYIDFCQYF